MARLLYAGLGVVIVVATVAGVYWYYQNQEAQAQFFSEALHTYAVVETVSLGGSKYEVIRGEVLQNGAPVAGGKELKAMRLAYALASARRLPALGLEGTDPISLADAIEALAKVKDEIAGVLPEASKQYESEVRESLYPLNFLRELAALERARQEFLVGGSDASAKIYEQQLSVAVAAYKKDLAAYKMVVAVVAKDNENLARQALSPSAPNPDGSPAQNGWFTGVDGLEQGITKMEEFVVLSRESCFAGDVRVCDPERDIALLPPFELSASATPSPSTSELARAPQIQTFLQKVFSDTSFGGGPIFELADASCAPALIGGSSLFALGEKVSPGSAKYQVLAYVSDMAFLSVNEVFPANSKAGAYLKEQDISYTPLWKTAHYACPGVGGDIGTILALEAIATAAKESGEFASSLIREEDARAYLVALRDSILQDKNASPDILNRLASLLLIYNAKSAGFDSVVWQIASVGERTVERARAAPALVEGTLSPVFLFSLDSGFFPLFLGHSPLAAGGQAIPQGPDSASLPASSYLLFSQLPLRGETEESIASDLQFFFGEGVAVQ